MAIAFEHFDAAGETLAGLRLGGTVSSGDHRDFAAHANRAVEAGATGLILDLSGLGSMSEDLAGELASCQRRLLDHDGELVFVDPNVVIGWFLDKRFGPLAHRCFDTVPEAEAALAAPPGTEPIDTAAAEEASEPPADWVVNVNESGRPDRFSFAVVQQTLLRTADPQQWLEPLRGMLRRTGLGRDLLICRREGERLELVGRRDYAFPANGWLGSLLLSADCPLGVPEIAGDGLSLPEKAFLKWCDTDVVVPVIDGTSRLRGALFVKSDRDGGLYSYRSGELLSLALLGRLLAEYLPSGETVPAPHSVEAAIAELLEPEALTV
ncbi:hypothetical protein H8E07_13545 [bacterium]|nr:hypothetical protein [bacterium]